MQFGARTQVHFSIEICREIARLWYRLSNYQIPAAKHRLYLNDSDKDRPEMPKPLRSDDPNPQPVQFAHFGVLNDGTRSKGATVTAIIINCTIAALVVILGMIIKTNPIVAKRITELTLPPERQGSAPAPKPPPPPPPPR